jgi:hypothetical protein
MGRDKRPSDDPVDAHPSGQLERCTHVLAGDRRRLVVPAVSSGCDLAGGHALPPRTLPLAPVVHHRVAGAEE